MAAAGVNYNLFFIDVRHPHLTEVYVFCEALGDCPLGVQGWHHKTFPASMNTVQILTESFDGTGEDPVLWPQDPPPFQLERR